MLYPNFLKIGDIIGICAPSDGIKSNIDLKRLNYAEKNINNFGFNIIKSNSCTNSKKGRSADAKIRANELEDLFLSKDVKSIICLAGGDFLVEILPYINFETIRKNSKWIQGYSDPTALLFTITTNLNIATIYGYNFKTFGMNSWHKSLFDFIDLLQGKKLEFMSYDKYEDRSLEYISGDEGFNLENNVYWDILGESESINMKGRIIGGCLDVILNLVGTPFDKTNEFIEKYKEDGIIWFFDNCELTSEALVRAMWQLSQVGYFKYVKGFLFGRSATNLSYYDISFKEAVESTLCDFDVPIILNADIGHKPPQIPIILGSIANINVNKGKGIVNYILK